MSRRISVGKVFIYMLLFVGALIMIIPIYWMITSSFKPVPEIMSGDFSILPKHWTISNYKTVFDKVPVVRYLLNSALCTVYQVVGCVVLSSLAGFALAKIQFPLRNVLFGVILITMFTPPQIRLPSMYMLMIKLHLVDTYHGIVLPQMLGPISVFLMRQGMLEIPDELIDAARIDGYSLFGVFWRIAIPLCQSIVIALMIFSFSWGWTSFLWPLIVTSSENMRTIEVGMAAFRNTFFVEYGSVMAIATIAMIPTLVFFVALQKRIISTIARTGVKV